MVFQDVLGHFWTSWDILGHFCIFLKDILGLFAIFFGCFRMFLDVLVHFLCLDVLGRIWEVLGYFGMFWDNWDIFGHV